MGYLLKAEAVHKTYRIGHETIPVLRGAALEVQPGERVAIIGLSGAGKSTLLHVLGGLDRPDQGTIRLDGEDLYTMSARRRTRVRSESIGFVFQSYHLLPELDVLENVMLPAMAYGGMRRRRQGLQRARELLDAVALSHRATHLPLELSGGEQQRAALVRALMNSPRLILADEPTGNLDEKTGNLVLDQLFALVRNQDTSLVMVTHNTEMAARCDRILRLDSGTIDAADAP